MSNYMNGGIHHEILPTEEIFRLTLPVDNLATGKPCTLKQMFSMHSVIEPTTWVLEMIFQKAPDDNIVSCFISLKRDDSSSWPLNVEIEMCFTYSKHRAFVHTEHFLIENMTDREIRRSIVDILPFNERMDLTQGVLVGVEITIEHSIL